MKPQRSIRIGDLDIWRGLCLVNVVLVHLAYNGLALPEPLDSTIKHYTRFAAGGFVFLAGLSVAVIFASRAEGTWTQRLALYGWCWRRAVMLAAVDVLGAAAYRLLDAVRVFPSDPDSPLLVALSELFAFQRPGITGGILQLYALLFAVWPLVFELRHWCGRAVVALASIALYATAVWSDPLLHWPPFHFPLAYWQLLFAAGFLSDGLYRYSVHCGWRARLAWGAMALLTFAFVFVDLHGPEFGFETIRNISPLDYRKTPLQPGAALWYLAAINVVLAWSSIAVTLGVRAGGTIQLLGRHSLLVYVAHVFTEALVLEYVWAVWPPVAIRLAVSLLDLAVLLALCHAVEIGLPRAAWRRLRAWVPTPTAGYRIPLVRFATAACTALWLGHMVAVRQPSQPSLEAPPPYLHADEHVIEAVVTDDPDVPLLDEATSPFELAPEPEVQVDDGLTPFDIPLCLDDEAQIVGPI